jgi:hypothetical protein
MSITKNVREWLEGEGFPLEMRVAAAFRKTGFDVRQSSFYMDPESGKGREIDVIATDPDYIGLVEIHFGGFQPSSDVYVLHPVILPPLYRYAHL